MTDTVVVDSDVFSFWVKSDTRGRLYDPDIEGRTVAISFMSVAETKRWALARNWGAAKRRILEGALSRCVVLPYDEALADAWAAICHARDKAGRPIGCGDCWIAATALRYDAPLLTHNAKDYRDIRGLRLISHA